MWELHPCKMDRLWIVVFVRFFTLALCFSHCCFFLGCGSGLHAVLYTLLLVKIWPILSPLPSFSLLHSFFWERKNKPKSFWSISSSSWSLFLVVVVYLAVWTVFLFKLFVNHSPVRCACLCSCCQSVRQSVRPSIPDSCVVVLVSSVSSGQLFVVTGGQVGLWTVSQTQPQSSTTTEF